MPDQLPVRDPPWWRKFWIVPILLAIVGTLAVMGLIRGCLGELGA